MLACYIVAMLGLFFVYEKMRGNEYGWCMGIHCRYFCNGNDRASSRKARMDKVNLRAPLRRGFSFGAHALGGSVCVAALI